MKKRLPAINREPNSCTSRCSAMIQPIRTHIVSQKTPVCIGVIFVPIFK